MRLACAALPIMRAQGGGRIINVTSENDPDEVARAIEDCIRASDPPARIVVGADAIRPGDYDPPVHTR